MRNVHLIDHPLVQHKLTLMRQKSVSTSSFRRLLNELAALMTYEVTRDMPTHEVEIETPLEKMKGRMIDGKKLVFVSILRAGNGILDGVLSVVPGARVGHIGLYRASAADRAGTERVGGCAQSAGGQSAGAGIRLTKRVGRIALAGTGRARRRAKRAGNAAQALSAADQATRRRLCKIARHHRAQGLRQLRSIGILELHDVNVAGGAGRQIKPGNQGTCISEPRRTGGAQQ